MGPEESKHAVPARVNDRVDIEIHSVGRPARRSMLPNRNGAYVGPHLRRLAGTSGVKLFQRVRRAYLPCLR